MCVGGDRRLGGAPCPRAHPAATSAGAPSGRRAAGPVWGGPKIRGWGALRPPGGPYRSRSSAAPGPRAARGPAGLPLQLIVMGKRFRVLLALLLGFFPPFLACTHARGGSSWLGSRGALEVAAGAFKEPLGAALQGAGRGFPRALGQRGFSVGLLLH